MAVNNEKVFSRLNDLIETLKDGEKGFKTAADGVEENDLKSLFRQFSHQRTEYIDELKKLVRQMGGDADQSGSITGALHRGWMDIKSAVANKDAEAILNECERGEDAAVKEFSEALNEDLPADVKSIVSRQYDGIKSVHDNVKSLRDSRHS